MSGITMDSRSVVEGDLFCCVRGANFDGHAFAVTAVEGGASALLVERYLSEVENVSQIIVANVREVIGRYAKTLYGDPSTKLRVVGITGTNGKTTTASLLSSILNAAGVTSQALGTLTNERTTPEAPILQKQLAQAAENDMQVVIMEVTSHAIDQSRINGIQFEIAVFTNISRDHLDYHETQEAYFAAKAALFRQDHAIRAVVNTDDTRGRLLFDAATIPMATFSLDDIAGIKTTASSIEFEWEGVGIAAPIGGRFNVMNLLAACTVARELGLTPKEIARATTQVQSVPGRFERVDAGQDFTVVVDFAHTPEGLAEVLQAGRAVCAGRVHVVFGCGGDRDSGKRPLMGGVAAQYSDNVMVTSDNPRSEDPLDIIKQILEGIPASATCIVNSNSDRRAAISDTLQSAHVGDIVIVAGKGHETTQEFAHHREEFDDVAVVRELLNLHIGKPA
ncbi:MAG: UDP-N-acetylmuramoyl-L-alanyl-D-glutamate--2,6-diaminopimelate ligase [Ilumatobacteraceae bacterium]|nr:UDP-N-acetylmuramoyl-L-alanyl-D-glutamate--2,6-diaminopimelate ligase [Ilumatobacteraceae bacterium]